MTEPLILFSPAARAELLTTLGSIERIVPQLQDDPDEVTIERALKGLQAIRDALREGEELKAVVSEVRDRLVATLSAEARELTMQTIAQAAGYGDSYAARVANDHGAGRRPRRRDSDPAPTGQGRDYNGRARR